MGAIYDFLFGENVGDTQRYRLRHRRDGLCYDCKSRATHFGRCFRHYELNKQKSREHYQARKEKGEAVG
jgi:hypothetical protein